MEAPKNKGGRPTKAEQLAKGITETELKRLLSQFKRVAPTIVANLISEIENKELGIKEKIKLQIDLLKMYESLLKTNKALLATGAPTEEPVVEDEPDRPIFRLAG